MKKIKLLAILGFTILSNTIFAQVKKSGAIQFETSFDPAAMAASNGIKLPDDVIARMPKASKTDFELLFTATNASYMRVEETEDSNGGNGGGGMRFGGFGGMGSHDYYYNFIDNRLIDVFDLSDTTYFLASKLGVSNMPAMGMGSAGPPVVEITKTDETKKILGFNCTKVIYKTTTKRKILEEEREITDVVNVWSTTELGFDFSPNLNYWQSGAVLAIEGKGSSVLATSLEYRNVSAKDVNLPKKGVEITAEQYKEKIARRMKGRGQRNGTGAGIRTISIN